MRRWPCVRQRDAADCGPACLATVCRRHGVKPAVGRLRDLAGTDKLGTSAFGLVKAARDLGFVARGVRGTLASLTAAGDVTWPAIAHVTSAEGLPHFVVLHRLRRGRLLLADPARGLTTVTPADFARRWSGLLILLQPSPTGLAAGPPLTGNLRRFATLVRGQTRRLALVGLASLVITVLGIVGAFYYQVIIDQVVPGQRWRTLTTVSLAILGLYGLRAVLEAARAHLVLHVQRAIDEALVLGYFRHVVGLPLAFFGSRRSGDIITRFEDATKIRQALASATVTLFVDLVMSVGGCVVLARQDLGLFAVAAAIAGLHGLLGLVVLRPVHRLNDEMMEANAQVTSHFVETIAGAETVKAYNAQARLTAQATRLYTTYLAKVFRYGQWNNAQAVVTDTLGRLGTVAILWLGAVKILQGGLTVGSLVVFVTLLDYFLNPVRNLLNLQPELLSAVVAARRLGDALDLEPEKQDGPVVLRAIDRPIVLDDVRFRYAARPPTLDHLSLTLQPGTTVGLVGESGSGKTTVAKLLAKFAAPESGTIRIGEVDLGDIGTESLRSRIAYIGQDTAFLSGTIAGNLRLAQPDATIEQMIRACRRAEAHDFIVALPGRYQALLDEGAGNLSGGQRQRLALARALLRRADLLILDEATSQLDSVSERAVARAVAGLGPGVTRLIIAHRLSTVVACDWIYVLLGGTVVEQGRHAGLLALGGVYQGLWRAQTGPEPPTRPPST